MVRIADFSVTTDFVAGNVISSSEMNTNFGDVETRYDILRLLHSGTGTSTATSEEDMDSHVFASGTFATTDAIRVIIFLDDQSGAVSGTCKLRAYDGTNTADSGDFVGAGNWSHVEVKLLQHQRTNTTIAYSGMETIEGATHTGLHGGLTSLDANAITAEWTLTLRGNVNTSGTLYYTWFVYKIDNE